MRSSFFSPAIARVSAQECVDPREYANSVVRIERVVENGAPRSWVGSGWFYQSRQVLITNEHVVSKLALQEQQWTSVLLQAAKPYAAQGFIQRTKARVLARDTRDDLALVYLEHPAMGVRPMDIKSGEVSPGEPLAIAGYASGLLHFGSAHAYAGPQPVARFRQPESQFAIDVQGRRQPGRLLGRRLGEPGPQLPGAGGWYLLEPDRRAIPLAVRRLGRAGQADGGGVAQRLCRADRGSAEPLRRSQLRQPQLHTSQPLTGQSGRARSADFNRASGIVPGPDGSLYQI